MRRHTSPDVRSRDGPPAGPYADFPGAIVEYDAEGRFVACSPAHLDLFPQCADRFQPGVARREIIKAYAETCDGAEAWLETNLAALDTPRGQRDEKLPDGRTMRISESSTPTGGIRCVATDVSDLATAEPDFDPLDDKLRYFAESSSDWFWETDENHRFTYVSPNVERIIGAAPEWFYGKTREDMMGDGHDEVAWQEYLELVRQHKPFDNFEYYRVGHGVPSKWLSTSGVPVFDEAGRFTGYRGIGRDITNHKLSELALQDSETELREIRATLERRVKERTRELRHEIAERKRAERALKESERRFRHAFEFAPIGIALLTPEGKRLKVNHALAEFLGATVDELRDTSINTAITSPEDLETDRAIRQAVIEGKRTTYHNERTYRRKDGEIVWGEVTGSLVRDEDGTPLYFVAQTLDTTQRRRNEELLRDANEKLEQHVAERTHELNATNEALRQEIAERERFRQSLQESEIRFQDFAKSASDWFWETDAEHRFVAFFDPQEMMPEGMRGQFLGRTRLDAANADPNEGNWQRHLVDLSAHRAFRNFQYSILHHGEERFWSINGRPIFDNEGNFTGYRGTGTDITEQVRLENRVAEQSTLLRNILDNLPLHVALLDTVGRYTFVNRYGAEKLGRAPSNFVGRLDEELFGIPVEGDLATAAKSVMSSGQPVINRTLRPSPWKDRDALLNIVPMMDAKGAPSGVLIVVQDMTELSEAQAAARERSALLNAIVEHVPASMIMKRAQDGVFLLTNEPFNRTIGLPKDQIIGRRTDEIHSNPELVRTIRRHETRVVQTRKAITEDREVAQPDGLRKMSVTKFPVFDETGEVVSIGSITVDITEQSRIEDQLRQSQKMEVVGQLTGGVAHDFNNLLGVVIGNLDFLEERLRSQPDLHQMVCTATNAALHGGELTRQLLAFSRRQPLTPRKIDLNLQLIQMHDLLRRTLGETVEVEINREPELWRCEADPSQVEAAILNLSINARDAMPSGGTLTLATENVVLGPDDVANEPELEAGEYVMLTVSDTGTGMAPEVQERAFEPFFTTKKVGEGSGLGLSMVFGFAKQSRGHVAIESEEGHGTTIRLYLPRGRRTDMIEITASRTEIPFGQGEHILVVEDDPDLRHLTVTQLENLGYHVVAASDGKSALETLQKFGHIDMLLTDVVLPGGIDGTVLSREVIQRQPDVKVLFMSGYSDHAAVQNDTWSTAVLLQKPFRKEDLARRVHDVLTG